MYCVSVAFSYLFDLEWDDLSEKNINEDSFALFEAREGYRNGFLASFVFLEAAVERDSS